MLIKKITFIFIWFSTSSISTEVLYKKKATETNNIPYFFPPAHAQVEKICGNMKKKLGLNNEDGLVLDALAHKFISLWLDFSSKICSKLN
jgi:hypothetical protein